MDDLVIDFLEDGPQQPTDCRNFIGCWADQAANGRVERRPRMMRERRAGELTRAF
ncbi:hypothetical protein ACTGJ9_026265 [Bradyrhizobium sp. RDM12]